MDWLDGGGKLCTVFGFYKEATSFLERAESFGCPIKTLQFTTYGHLKSGCRASGGALWWSMAERLEQGKAHSVNPEPRLEWRHKMQNGQSLPGTPRINLALNFKLIFNCCNSKIFHCCPIYFLLNFLFIYSLCLSHHAFWFISLSLCVCPLSFQPLSQNKIK